ncbi:MAG TPA: putative peptidoglycan glycosyltransferase FtsW [Armatimonadota bacterium]|nr:putative peptidoglycan glycosyltransferase FtsW [Armatimonadota bacterium]
MRQSSPFDFTLFVTVVLLIAVGWIFIYSASYPRAMVSSDTDFNSFYYAFRQIIFTVGGAVAMGICWLTPLHIFRRASFWIMIGGIALLIIVLIFAPERHGNRASIDIGPVQLQGSEFAKIAIVLSLAAYLARRPWMVKTWQGLVRGPLWFVVVPFLLIIFEKDMGMTFAVTLSATLILLIAGMKFRFVGVPLLILGVLGVAVWGGIAAGNRATHGALMEQIKEVGGQRFERVLAWLDPFDTSLAASFHPRNSLIAIGSGGLLGRGITESRQKWFYLPAPHNDYIVAVIGEELGFLGAILVLGLYTLLVFRGFTVAHGAPDEYAALVAVGCTVMLATTALVNLAVATNLLPSIGLNLPFISYGGSSLIASMMMAGLLLNVSRQRPARERRRPEIAEPAMM